MQRDVAGASLTAVSILAVMKLKRMGRASALAIVDGPIDETEPEGCREALLTRVRGRLPLVQSTTISDAWARSEEQLNRGSECGVRAISFHDDEYPARLRKISDPPALLFVKGDLQGLHAPRALAVVGTRKPTPNGAALALRSGHIAVESGYAIISGLALGCDTSAHEGCLQAGGTGVAVLAHGLDRVYPASNRDLADRLLDNGGCLTSEYPVGMTPTRSAFAQRDRIQSGLSDGVLVIETDIRGGTMHTVRFALEQERALACIHLDHLERFHSEVTTRGNRKLVEQGDAQPIGDRAALIEFLNDLHVANATQPAPRPAPTIRETQMSLGF